MHLRLHPFMLACALAAAVAACARPAPPGRTSPATSDASLAAGAPLTRSQRRWVDRTLAGLSLRERVGQMVEVWVLGDYTSAHDPSFEEVRRWITRDGVGSVTMSLGSPIEVAEKINAMQRMARVPLMVASDVEPNLGRLEGGTFTPSLLTGGGATVLPTNMAIAAAGDERLAYEAGRVTGAEARAVGIRVAFAPVVDVNSNPANPVINTRSFGEDPSRVSRFATAFIRGVQSQGVAATAKHFPGHGDTDTDSHLSLPVVRSDRARLDAVELAPFRAAIAAGVANVMTAHIALPAVQGDSTPATLTPTIVTGLLRDSLRFRGLTYTDALTMEGIGQGYPVERSAVLAVKAGADVLLKPSDPTRAIDAVVAAVLAGEIPAARIDRSVRKILEQKARAGLAERRFVRLDALREVVGAPAHRGLARRIAERAVTLLRDAESLVPATALRSAAVVSYAPEAEVVAGRTFDAEVRANLPEARSFRIGPRTGGAELDSIARVVHGVDRVFVVTSLRRIEGNGNVAVPPPVARWIDSLATVERVVVIANGNPYVLRQLPRVGSYVATYGVNEVLERAAARAVLGRAPITGRAPISLPGFYARGDGLARAVSLASSPTPAMTRALQESLRQILDRAVIDSAFPGAYAAVGNRDGVIAAYGAGRLDWGRPGSGAADPVPDSTTLWDLASLTKVVGTTSAIMQLVEAGRVDLDAPTQRYLPGWNGRNKERVTIRHLLTHSSGLPAWRPLYKEAPSPEAALALVYATELDTVPGARMVYSDLGAILLGQVVERVSGERLDEYLRRHVFAPLGMTSTGYRPEPAWRDRIAPTEYDPWRQRHLRGEVHDENAYALGGVSGHAGLFSTGRDVARFARMYLNGGAVDGIRIFGATTIDRFTRVQDSAFSNRALGWETPSGGNSSGHRMSPRAFGHTGFTGTSLWVDPLNDLFVLLLTNRVNPTRENRRISDVRVAVADAVLGIIDPAGEAAAAGTRSSVALPAVPPSPAPSPSPATRHRP
jgi:beta-glucosidase-like glycosyl hydrolase/CubicO group peptidase (beta-lactamase class C family)